MELLPQSIHEFKRLLYTSKRHGDGSFVAVAIAAESVLLADRDVGYGDEGTKDPEEIKRDLEKVDFIIKSTSEYAKTSLAILEEAYYKNNPRSALGSFEVENNFRQNTAWNVATLHKELWQAMRQLNNIVMKIAIKYKLDMPTFQPQSQQNQKIEF
jgi:hypothetical protein